MKRSFGALVAFLFVFSNPALACPWGGNAYRASGNNGEILLRPNADCTELKVSRITKPSEYSTFPMAKKGKNWVAKLSSEYSFSFGPNERTIRLFIGVRSERKGFAKVSID